MQEQVPALMVARFCMRVQLVDPLQAQPGGKGLG